MECQNPELNALYTYANKVFFVIGFKECFHSRTCYKNCNGEIIMFPDFVGGAGVPDHCLRVIGQLMIRKLEVGDENGS